MKIRFLKLVCSTSLFMLTTHCLALHNYSELNPDQCTSLIEEGITWYKRLFSKDNSRAGNECRFNETTEVYQILKCAHPNYDKMKSSMDTSELTNCLTHDNYYVVTFLTNNASCVYFAFLKETEKFKFKAYWVTNDSEEFLKLEKSLQSTSANMAFVIVLSDYSMGNQDKILIIDKSGKECLINGTSLFQRSNAILEYKRQTIEFVESQRRDMESE